MSKNFYPLLRDAQHPSGEGKHGGFDEEREARHGEAGVGRIQEEGEAGAGAEEEAEEGVAGRAQLVPKYWKKLKEQKEPASLGPHMVKADSTEGKPNTKAGK